MMRLNEVLGDHIKEEFEVHFSSKDHVYEKLLKKFPDQKEKIMGIRPLTCYGPSAAIQNIRRRIKPGQCMETTNTGTPMTTWCGNIRWKGSGTGAAVIKVRRQTRKPWPA